MLVRIYFDCSVFWFCVLFFPIYFGLPSIYLFVFFFFNLMIYLFIHPFIYIVLFYLILYYLILSIYLFVHPSIHLSISLSLRVPFQILLYVKVKWLKCWLESSLILPIQRNIAKHNARMLMMTELQMIMMMVVSTVSTGKLFYHGMLGSWNVF